MNGAPGSSLADPVVGDAPRVHRLSTPQRLRSFRMAILAGAALLLLVGELTLSRARAALNTIARDAAPSILAAQEIRFALADLDANAANALVGTDDAHRVAAETAIEQRRVHVANALVRAAENITYGEDERAPVRAMFLAFGVYLERIAEARLLQDRGEKLPARGAYFVATALMHTELFKQADALDSVNKSHLDAAYDAQSRADEGAVVMVVALGVGLGVALAWSQLFLAKRTRRILNLPLVAATILGLFFVVYLVDLFKNTREDLRIATRDAFDSVYALSHARAVAYDANGDESRYLLDPSGAKSFADDFQRNVARLTSTPGDVKATSAEIRQLREEGRKARTQKGYLWDELANVTFVGEGAAAEATLRAFDVYYAIDQKMRGLERAGKHDAAVELCIGTRPDESNAAFATFDRALTLTEAINQKAFDETVARADASLKRAEWLDPAIAIAVALLAWFGIRPRLREYSP